MPASKPARRSLPPADPWLYQPTSERPLRCKARRMEHQMDIHPHRHDWAQLVFSTSGAVRVSTVREAQGRPKLLGTPSGGRASQCDDLGGPQLSSTFIVPPSRAVWIPTGVVHAVTAIEQAELRTLYLLPGLLSEEVWAECRVLEVAPLLRELVSQLATEPDEVVDCRREALITELVLDELKRAKPLSLGIALPRDARLRRLCQAMLDAPERQQSLEAWAADAGASPRTISRLFRDELGTSFAQWRSQVLLAHALTLAARARPMAHIAAELGYANASAFSAMVRRTVGMPPSRFFAAA